MGKYDYDVLARTGEARLKWTMKFPDLTKEELESDELAQEIHELIKKYGAHNVCVCKKVNVNFIIESKGLTLKGTKIVGIKIREE